MAGDNGKRGGEGGEGEGKEGGERVVGFLCLDSALGARPFDRQNLQSKYYINTYIYINCRPHFRCISFNGGGNQEKEKARSRSRWRRRVTISSPLFQSKQIL